MTFQLNAGSVFLFNRIARFATWLQQWTERMTPPQFRLVQIGSAFWQSRALYVAAKLDIATALANEEICIADLARSLSVNPDALARLMRFLAAMGVFERVSPDIYRNNGVSSYLRSDNPKNVRALILMHNSEAMSRPWYEKLDQGIREGKSPFELIYGEQVYSYLDSHDELAELFSRAMDDVKSFLGDSFARDFEWGAFNRIIDLGGSRGTKALAIIQRHPGMKALIVDRPAVIDDARRYWKARDSRVLDLLRFEQGDIRAGIPEAVDAGDVYLLSAVLHGFDDDSCVEILANINSAIGNSGARCILMEMILPEMNVGLAGASFDMQMFMGTCGKERTLSQWIAVASRSGFVVEEIVHLRSLRKIMVLKTDRHIPEG